jgi:hypothetical protein
MGFTLARILLAGVVAACGEANGAAAHIRTTSCRLKEAVAQGMVESDTFRRLVERVAALKGIVYLSERPAVAGASRRQYDGFLEHRVVRAGDYRLLYVVVSPGLQRNAAPVIGHELQHVIEVLEGGVDSERGVDELFERTGARGSSYVTETVAAEARQREIASELRAARKK